MSQQALIAELAKALGLPKNTVKAVLTLDTHKAPTLEATTILMNEQGFFVVEPDPDHHTSSKVERLATVMRKFKIVPIDD